MSQAKLTSKGQITVPKSIRELLHLKTGDRIEFLVAEDGTVRLWPVTRHVSSLKGLIEKPARPVSTDEMNAVIRRRSQ